MIQAARKSIKSITLARKLAVSAALRKQRLSRAALLATFPELIAILITPIFYWMKPYNSHSTGQILLTALFLIVSTAAAYSTYYFRRRHYERRTNRKRRQHHRLYR